MLYCCVFRFVNFFFLLSTSSSVVWNVFLPEIRLILSYMQNLWLARSRSLIFWPHWHNLFVWIILRAFSDYFSILFFYWCSLNFGRVYIKPWKKRILCVNLRWFWCCERSNALKKKIGDQSSSHTTKINEFRGNDKSNWRTNAK